MQSWRIVLPIVFPLVGFAVLGAISIATARSLSGFIEERLLRQEARLTQEFVENIVHVEKAEGYFRNAAGDNADMKGTFEHVAKLPDVLHVNMYSPSGTVIWSTRPELIGRHLGADPDLADALRGKLIARGSGRYKPEHAYLSPRYQWFVEIYSPVRALSSDAVIGVVEIYRAPQPLLSDIREAQDGIWATSLLSDLVLLALFLWLLRRSRTLTDEQRDREAREELRERDARVKARA